MRIDVHNHIIPPSVGDLFTRDMRFGVSIENGVWRGGTHVDCGYFPYQAGRLKHARRVRPELADAPADPFAYVERIWFDTITHDAAALRFLVDRVGVDQVVLGTDLPFDMAHRRPCELLEAALDADGSSA
jgi:hypothetical protein